jgi:Uma2 family endonuclease
MSATAHQPMTLAEFLFWEERQEARFEFDGFGPVAMNGGTWAHNTIAGNIWAALRDRLRGKPCKAATSNQKIEAVGRIRYPDAFVVCSPVAPKATVVRDPVVVFEVISASTAQTDRFHKLREYSATPSIQRYVILEQDALAAMVYVRIGEHMRVEAVINDEVLHMPEIGISIQLAEFYEGVEAETIVSEDDEPPGPR